MSRICELSKLRNSGVTLHKINKGIDTGDIVDQKRFKIKINDTAYDNYFRLMHCSVKLLKNNVNNILNSNYSLRKQNLSNGRYYKRSSVDYKKILNFNMKKPSLNLHNKIRSIRNTIKKKARNKKKEANTSSVRSYS